MQVEPMKSKLKAPGAKRLRLNYYNLLSNFAFNLNMRRYTEVQNQADAAGVIQCETWQCSPRHRVTFNSRNEGLNVVDDSARCPYDAAAANEVDALFDLKVGRCRLNR